MNYFLATILMILMSVSFAISAEEMDKLEDEDNLFNNIVQKYEDAVQWFDDLYISEAEIIEENTRKNNERIYQGMEEWRQMSNPERAAKLEGITVEQWKKKYSEIAKSENLTIEEMAELRIEQHALAKIEASKELERQQIKSIKDHKEAYTIRAFEGVKRLIEWAKSLEGAVMMFMINMVIWTGLAELLKEYDKGGKK